MTLYRHLAFGEDFHGHWHIGWAVLLSTLLLWQEKKVEWVRSRWKSRLNLVCQNLPQIARAIFNQNLGQQFEPDRLSTVSILALGFCSVSLLRHMFSNHIYVITLMRMSISMQTFPYMLLCDNEDQCLYVAFPLHVIHCAKNRFILCHYVHASQQSGSEKKKT